MPMRQPLLCTMILNRYADQRGWDKCGHKTLSESGFRFLRKGSNRDSVVLCGPSGPPRRRKAKVWAVWGMMTMVSYTTSE